MRPLAAALVLATFAQPALADDWPSRAVRIVVPFAAGGPADVYARIVAMRLQQSLKQPFVVEDHPGAGSIIGTELVHRAAPDGYTLLLMSNTHTVNESLFRAKPYALLRDFAPVAPINASDLVLAVRPGLGVSSLADLLRLAKAQPGRLTYASSGPGTPYHMAGEMLKALAGVDVVHVPYKGSGAARNDLLGGQVDMMIDAVTTMAGFARTGRVKALATTGAKRSAALPDVPTMAEAGVPGYDAVIWLGVMAPKGTPAAIVARLNAEVTRIASDPEVRAQWAKDGAEPMTMGVDAFRRFVEDDIGKWARVVERAHVKVEP